MRDQNQSLKGIKAQLKFTARTSDYTEAHNIRRIICILKQLSEHPGKSGHAAGFGLFPRASTNLFMLVTCWSKQMPT